MKEQIIQTIQQVADNVLARFVIGGGVTANSIHGLLTETAGWFQLVGSIVGPMLVIATLIHVIIKIRKDL